MHKPSHLTYAFDDFTLDLSRSCLLREGREVKLRPKSFEALRYLVENRGRLVEKPELIKAIWPDSFVTDDSLVQCLIEVRRALGDDSHHYIKTVARRGYIFDAAVGERSVGKEEVVYTEEIEGVSVAFDEEGNEAESRLAVSRAGRSTKLRLEILAASVILAGLTAAAFYLWTSSKLKQLANPTVKSIAVLPFKPLVEGSRNESLELGMADTLITKLSSSRQITIRPISAVRKYTGIEQDPIAAGREQDVDAVLDGSIQWEGERIRVTSRLLRVADGATIWADKCDQQCASIFEAQDSISQKITTALALHLSSIEQGLLTKHYTQNDEAYKFYLRGRFYMSKSNTAESIKKALYYFEQAVAKDPNYALAYAGLADSYAAMRRTGINLLPAREAMLKAKESALDALELDDTLAEAHVSLARVKYWFEWDWAGAEKELLWAIELNPNSAIAHITYSTYLSMAGRHDESIAEMKRALEIEPLNPGFAMNLGLRLYIARRYGEAIQQFLKAQDMDASRGHSGLGWAYEQKGLYKEAIAEYSKADRDNDVTLANLARAYARSGNRSEAQKNVKILKARSKKQYVSAYLISTIYAALGDKEQGLYWLEKAYQERDDWIVWIKVDPALDFFRSDGRFEELLRRVGFS